MERQRQEAVESLNFGELFGDVNEYGKIQDAARKVEKVQEKADVVVLREGGVVRSVSINFVPAELYQNIYSEFAKMGVYPWTEENKDGSINFSIENRREIQKLRFFSLFDTDPESVISGTENVGSNRPTEIDPYAFPLPNLAQSNTGQVKKNRPKTLNNYEEVPEVDLWIQHASDNFNQGLEFEIEPEPKPKSKFYPNLKLFKQEYFFEGDKIFDTRGAEVPFEQYKRILLAAKEDPESMKLAVKMSAGLVKFTLDRMLDRFRPNRVINADDLFQAGMEGLVKALDKLEERETRPSSYLVPWIEGYMRNELRTQKEGYKRKVGTADEIAKYLKAKAILERGDPEYFKLTLAEREEKIAARTNMSLERVALLTKEIKANAEEYDHESVEHNEVVSEDERFVKAGSIEHEQLIKSISEILNKIAPQYELPIRLYYGIVGDSHWRHPDDKALESLFDESRNSNIENGSLKDLLNFDVDTDSLKDLNNAEKMFLALVGKIPEESVGELYNNSVGKPTEVSLAEVARVFGNTPERIRQTIARGLRELKLPSRRNSLVKDGYLKKERYRTTDWHGNNVERTRYGLDES